MSISLALGLWFMFRFTSGESCGPQTETSVSFSISYAERKACYFVSQRSTDFSLARSFCESVPGAHLAFLETDLEHTSVYHYLVARVWLGIEKTAGQWYWTDSIRGTSVLANYTDWNNSGSGFDRGVLTKYSPWEQVQASETNPALCEIENYVSIQTGNTGTQTSSLMLFSPSPVECVWTIVTLSATECARHCLSDGDCDAVAFSTQNRACCRITPLTGDSSSPLDPVLYDFYEVNETK